MKNGDIIVIDSVRELLDDKQQEVGRIITDKAGNETKVKKGQGGKLAERWEWLEGEGIGKAIKLTVGEFKGYPYVADFTVVKDEFVAQAAEKVQTQVKVDRNDSIEAQVAFKGMVELLIADKLDEDETNATISWAMVRLDLPSKIMITIEGAKGETTKDTKDNQKTQGEPTDRQDGGEETERVSGFLKYLENHDIKDTRLFLKVEYHIPEDEKLTEKKCEELYKQIRKDKQW